MNFHGFHPRRVQRAIPDAWACAEPRQLIDARLSAMDAALGRRLGDAIDGPDVRRAASLVGVVRTDQGWIGGTSPLDAHLVTPPPEHVPDLLDDLVAYVNRTDVDPVAQAAIAHAQFALIHPFPDGNGRVGRVLIAWILVRRLSLVTPPPVSTRIAADVGGYSSGLVQFRLGEHDRWVQWFADAVSRAGRAQQEQVIAVQEMRRAWEERLAAPRDGARRLRSNAAAWRVLDLLPRHLVLTAPAVAAELKIPLKSASAALRELVAAGVLVEHGTVQPAGLGRPRRLFTSPELLGLAGSKALKGVNGVSRYVTSTASD